MTELIISLNKIPPLGLAFDILPQHTIPPELYEAVNDYAIDILNNKMFIKNYKDLIIMVIQSEFNKRPNLSLRQKVLIKEQIWDNATKNLNILAMNTAVKYIKIQLQHIFS